MKKRETSKFGGRLRACKTPELSLRNLLLLFWATTTISPRRLSRRGSNKPWRIVRSPLGRSAKDSGRMERECGADVLIKQITAAVLARRRPRRHISPIPADRGEGKERAHRWYPAALAVVLLGLSDPLRRVYSSTDTPWRLGCGGVGPMLLCGAE